MKNIYSLFLTVLVLMIGTRASCQTTAQDFTQDECGGSSHHLYTELDAGNVVILEYVMLNCAPCILGTKALESITAPYAASHPGRVHLYSFGFLNSYTCEQMLAWQNDNHFTHPVFNNGEEQVNYYGGMGMPTIVVVGTNDHKVFFKSIGYTSEIDDDIKAALDSALRYNPTGVEENIGPDRFKVYPTVFTDRFYIETGKDLHGAEVMICDYSGRLIQNFEIPASGLLTVPAGNLPGGMYFVRLSGIQGVSESIKLIRK